MDLVAVITLSTKGQIVIPKRIREALKLQAGTRLSVELEGEKVVLKPLKGSVAGRLYGRFRGTDLLKDLEKEHRREIERDERRFKGFSGGNRS